MRIKYDYRTASKETYNKFKLAFPDISISYQQYRDILIAYSDFFKDYIIQTGDICKLPYGFGYFTVVKKKIKRYKNFNDPNGKPYINLPIDWKASKEEGKRVYHMNFHTDGFRCKWFWHVGSARFSFINTVVFKPSRDTSRSLAKVLNKPNSTYIQLYRELINNRFS